MRLTALSIAVLAVAGAACGEDAGPSGGRSDASTALDAAELPDAAQAPALTYFEDVKPIIDARCAQCHYAGGIAPFSLKTYDELAAVLPLIGSAVGEGRMPPWHASDTCNSYSNDRSLGSEELDAIMGWLALGAPRGNPENEAPPLPQTDPGLTRTDRMLPVEGAYTPQALDDYRCFVVEWPENDPIFVTGYNLQPSNPALVHHANIYAIAPAAAGEFRDLQAEDAVPGYGCYGGIFSESATLLGSWAPGSHGVEFPRGAGILVEPGSVVVMELHFNQNGGPGEDRSTLLLKVEPEVERRGLIVAFFNFFEWPRRGGMPIASGAEDAMHSFEFDPLPFRNVVAPWLTTNDIQLHAVGMHMHQLGKSGTVQILRPDGDRECLLEIEDWAFEWQTGYLLREPIDFTLGQDRLYLECHWDNSEANQPWINGQPQPPRDVHWGAGSSDEMCIGYVLITAR